MEEKRFTKNDSGFVCTHCGRKVEPLGYSSRDHCPFCLVSLHVDVMPGDRANSCHGKLLPVQALPHPKKGYIIVYKCLACGQTVRNRSARDDNSDFLISLTVNRD